MTRVDCQQDHESIPYWRSKHNRTMVPGRESGWRFQGDWLSSGA